MRHLSKIGKNLPVMALLEDHPGLLDSLSAFLKDPIGVIRLHFD